MPYFRVTTFMGQANMGWSETWWIFKSTINQAIAALAPMLDFRNTILSAQHSIIATRVASKDRRRKAN